MKKFIVTLTLITITLISQAHNITPNCASGTRAAFSGTQFDKNQWVYVHINTSGVFFINGTKDSVFNTGNSTSFSFRVPKPTSGSVSIEVKYNTNGNNHMQNGNYAVGGNPAISSNVQCTLTLPVSITYFKVSKISNGIVAKWATSFEVNSDYFEVWGSNDAVSFTKLGKIAANNGGTSPTPQEYSFTKIFSVNAGFSLIGIALVLGMALSKVRRKIIIIPLVLVMILASVTSCTKTNDVAIATPVSYKYFKLTQADKDGSVTSFNAIVTAN